jgi:hypothetical protein
VQTGLSVADVAALLDLEPGLGRSLYFSYCASHAGFRRAASDARADPLGEVLRVGGAFFLSLDEHIADSAPDFVYADARPLAAVAGESASSNETLRAVCAGV